MYLAGPNFDINFKIIKQINEENSTYNLQIHIHKCILEMRLKMLIFVNTNIKYKLYNYKFNKFYEHNLTKTPVCSEKYEVDDMIGKDQECCF